MICMRCRRRAFRGVFPLWPEGAPDASPGAPAVHGRWNTWRSGHSRGRFPGSTSISGAM